MSTYILLFVSLASFVFLSTNASKSQQRLMGLITLFAISLFQGLRWRTGTDWTPHYDLFMYANRFQVWSAVEPGFFLFNRFVRYFTNHYTVFLVVSCFLHSFLIMKFAEYAKVGNTSMVLLASFAGAIFPVRIALATSIYLNAYRYIVERNLLKYVCVALIAASFHGAALITLPFYLIGGGRLSSKWLICVYLCSCVLGFATSTIFEGLSSFFSLGIFESSNYAEEKIRGNLSDDIEVERSILSIAMSWLNGFVFILFFCYLRKKYFEGDNKFYVFFAMYVFGLSFNRLVVNAIPYMARVAQFFAGGFSILILWWIAKQKPWMRLILIIVYIIYVFLIYRKTLVGEYEDLFVPYYSVFSPSQRTTVY